MPGSDIAVIIPVLNEAANIKPLVEELDRHLGDHDWEAVFVDDDSHDGTLEELRRLRRENDRVRFLRRLNRRGLATAAIAGILSTNARWIVVMDADGQHSPAVIPQMIACLAGGEADIVSAARDLDSVDQSALSPGRRRLSEVTNKITGFLLKREIQDAMSGYMAMTAEAFESTAHGLSDAGFKLLLDLLVTNPGLQHLEIPHTFHERRSGESKLDFAVAWQFFCFLAAKALRGTVPVRLVSFLMVGLTGIAVHFLVLLPLLASTNAFTASQMVAAVLATAWNYWLNNALTFRDRRLIGRRFMAGLVKYQLVAAIGILANVAVASALFVKLSGLVAVSAIAGILVDTVWKYFISDLFIWQRR